MTTNRTLTDSRLREILDYDKITGIFRWRVARRGVKAGDVAGSVDTGGYRQIGIDGQSYQASRLVWLYVYGAWPKAKIDHKNTARDDQCFENLRDVTPSGNAQNQRQARRNNKTGLLGVHSHNEKFRAQIRLNGKLRHLGLFDTAESAHAAYVSAKREIHITCTI